MTLQTTNSPLFRQASSPPTAKGAKGYRQTCRQTAIAELKSTNRAQMLQRVKTIRHGPGTLVVERRLQVSVVFAL